MDSLSRNDPNRWLARALIAALICLILGVNLAVPAAIHHQDDYMTGLAVGICVGQVNLIALWGALAAGNPLLRLPWSLLLGVLMWYSLIFGCHLIESPSISPGDSWLLGVVLLVGVVSAQIPLWIAGRVFRWRLVRGLICGDERQFSLGQLLAGIFLLSVVLAAGRVVLPDGGRWEMDSNDEVWVFVAALIASNLVITLPCIWGSFARLQLLIPLSAAWLLYCALLTWIEFGTICWILGAPGESEFVFVFYLMNLAQCGTVFGVLLLLRAIGFRFVRVPRNTRSESVERGDISNEDQKPMP